MASTKQCGLLLVMMEVDPAHEEEFNRWYEEEHFPERMSCPGFIKGRRFVAKEGEPKYLAMYDLEGPEALETEEYKAMKTRTPWSNKIHHHIIRSIRNVYVEIPVKPHPVPKRG